MPRNDSSSGNGVRLLKPAKNSATPLGTPFVRSNDSVLPTTGEPDRLSVGVPLLPGQPSPCDDTLPISMLTSIARAALSNVPLAAGGPNVPIHHRRVRFSLRMPLSGAVPFVDVIWMTTSSTPLKTNSVCSPTSTHGVFDTFHV